MSAYLAVLLLSILFPAAFTFRGPWAADAREWRRILPAVFLAAVPFILWDIAFTRAGVWGFNPRYLAGIGLFGLPLEEMLFFLCVPFACLFIYRAVKANPRLAVPGRLLRPLWGGLAAGAAFLAFAAWGRVYTQAVSGLLAVMLAWHAVRLPAWSGAFAAAAALHFIPFLIVNGYLTALPVFRYDPGAILGYRIGTIPAEDAAYSLCLLLLNVAIYEFLQGRPDGVRGRLRDRGTEDLPASADGRSRAARSGVTPEVP